MTKNLGGKWKVMQATGDDPLSAARKRTGWLEARVPGCVHLDLMEAGRMPDPFYGLNELDVQWVEGEDWLYSRGFRCPAGLLQAERVELVCEGLDTFATVFLNGRKVGRAEDMFHSWRWDVTGLLRSGQNRLLVFFESPKRVARALEKKHGPLPSSFESARPYVRKEQCATGFDWAPRLNSCGIWRPIYLHAYEGARIADVYAPVDWSDAKRPVINLQVEVDAVRAGEVALIAELGGAGSVETVEFGGRVKKGSNILRADIAVRDPQLWWPAGQGPQNLYDLRVGGAMDGKALDKRTMKTGLRRVELRREKDEDGESFVICVNDRPVFCKGANWVPADSFLPRLTHQRYEDLIGRAVRANMNMLRVWGGGIYETDEFYETCDRLGVMVWQDFMFACACYPDKLDPFMDGVRSEAEENVQRLRNHPSLVLWCGNNENHLGCHSWWGKPEGPWGGKIYHELLPDVCKKLDPQRPYWPGSPYGGEDPNSTGVGDQHCWEVWHGWKSAEAYGDFGGRFVSEFGMQAPPSVETIHRYVPAAERHMQSRTMTHHNKAELGTERLYRYLAEYFRVPADFEDCVYLMQLVQGEVVKVGVEHWRARKFRTAGTLFWQHNDCWPATSWSCVDYGGRPKALYYYAKRFFAPVLPVIAWRDGRLSIIVVNDGPGPFRGTLACGLIDVDGSDVWTSDVTAEVPANGLGKVLARETSQLGLTDPARQFVWCRLLEGRRVVGSNTCFFAPYEHVAFPSVDWEVGVEELGRRSFAVTLESRAFAKGVWLRVEGMEADFEDNFFDMLESVPVMVRVTTEYDTDGGAVARRLKIRTVADVH